MFSAGILGSLIDTVRRKINGKYMDRRESLQESPVTSIQRMSEAEHPAFTMHLGCLALRADWSLMIQGAEISARFEITCMNPLMNLQLMENLPHLA